MLLQTACQQDCGADTIVLSCVLRLSLSDSRVLDACRVGRSKCPISSRPSPNKDHRLHDLVRMMGRPYLIKGSAMQMIQWCRRENASADRASRTRSSRHPHDDKDDRRPARSPRSRTMTHTLIQTVVDSASRSSGSRLQANP